MTILKPIFSFLLLILVAASLKAQSPTAGEREASAIPASASAVNPIEKESKIPVVNFTTPEGKSFDLNAFVKEQPVVLIFYRGGWCPYCNVHLQELMEADPELRALGYEILAVSPDPPEKLAESVEKHKMTYRLLSDSAMNGSKAFGVAYQADSSTVNKYKKSGIELTKGPAENQHLLPVPSVFIIDQKGTLRYVYYNADFRTRIKNKDLLQAAKKHSD